VHLSISLRILGLLLTLFSVAMLPPLLIAVLADDDTVTGFLSAFGITLISGLLLWLPLRRVRRELLIRDGFLVTALFWSVLGVFGSLPFMLSESLQLAPVDAVFESISGLTTTGATVLTGLDDMAPSILLYRHLLQWLGGIGIIVVAVAVLPMLGIGGMQLYRAETPGPSKDSKLTPRITETAKALFSVYLLLTMTCAGAYALAGMSASTRSATPFPPSPSAASAPTTRAWATSTATGST
jgi:trk system potassium uptake protein TrkH